MKNEIRARLEAQTKGQRQTNALTKWESKASDAELDRFREYVVAFLEVREAGGILGWTRFAEILSDDLEAFNVQHQALKAALGERIRRL